MSKYILMAHWHRDYRRGNDVPGNGSLSRQWDGWQGAGTALPEPALKAGRAVLVPPHRDFTTQTMFRTLAKACLS